MNNERLAQFKDKLKEFTKLDDEVADAINLLADIVICILSIFVLFFCLG